MNKTIPTILFSSLFLASCSLGTTSSTLAPSPTIVAMVSGTPVVAKDGIYQADGSYQSPAGTETIGVKLTIAKGLISDVSIDTSQTTNRTSLRMQTAFAGGIKEQVVGKKITDLNITKIAGSSLTGKGFNQALEKIKAQM